MTPMSANTNTPASNPPVSENSAEFPSPSPQHEGAASRQQKLLCESAKASAANDPTEFCLRFNADTSGLTEKSRTELAKWLSETSLWDLAENFQKFAISNEESRIEIAWCIAKENCYSLVKNIQNFEISNESAMIELAYVIAEKEPALFIKKFQNFEISNERVLIELLYKVAEEHLRELVENFQNVGISNESVRIELVHKIAEKHLEDLIGKSQKLGIFFQSERDRVAYEAAERKLHYLVSHIQDFKISNESAKIELAQLIAKTCQKFLVENIQKFEITDERERIRLAKIVAEKDLEVLVRNFQNFAISDERTKLELAQTLIRKHLSTSLIDEGYFEKLQISNPSAQANLYALAYLGLIAKGEMSAIDKRWINQFFPHDPKPMSLDQVAKQFGNHHPVIEDLLDAAMQQSDPHIREILSTWAQLVSLRFAADQLPEAAWHELKGPLEAIWKWHAPAMRYVLTHLLAQQCLPSEAKDANGFFAFCKQFTRPHTRLYPALLFPLFQSTPDDPTLKELMPLLRQSDFKDAKRQKAMVNALVALAQADHLSDDLKRSLLQAALPDDSDLETALPPGKKARSLEKEDRSLRKRARSLGEIAPLMECLVSFAQHSPKNENAVVLQRLKSIGKPGDFNEQMNKVFQDLFPDLPNAQNAADQFNRYRKHARHATGLITYTVKMQNYWNHREKKSVLAAIDQFVNATVLSPDPEHAFQQLRYDPANSENLRLLKEKSPKAFEQWKQSCIYEPSAAFRNQAAPFSRQDDKHLFVIDTDAAEDLFLCGTEVAESCQSIQNIPYNNKTLMGYVLDGKYRMLAITSEDGHLMGRRMLRLLWDKREEQPVLHLECFYKNPGIPKKYELALVELALQKAKKMNCALVSHDTELTKLGNLLGDPSFAQLIAFPTPWPFESVDADKPRVVAGKEGYELPYARFVLSPH